MTRAFFDSNVLIYSVKLNDARRDRASAVLDNGGVISIQSLNEFASVALRKLKMTYDRVIEATDIIIGLCDPVLPLTLEMHQMGLRIAQQYKLALYDGMIAAAALQGDCDVLYSEDMHAGLVIDGRLTIVNPFA